jgi:hypothetical protein
MKKVSFKVYSDSGFETDVILHVDNNTDSYIKQMVVRTYVENGFFVKNIKVEDLEYEESN